MKAEQKTGDNMAGDRKGNRTKPRTGARIGVMGQGTRQDRGQTKAGLHTGQDMTKQDRAGLDRKTQDAGNTTWAVEHWKYENGHMTWIVGHMIFSLEHTT